MNLKQAYNLLKSGNNNTVTAVAKGNSMSKYIKNGSRVGIKKYNKNKHKLNIGNIVLCKIKGNIYLHLIGAIRTNKKSRKRYRIESQSGHVNGWIGDDNIAGILVKTIK